MTDAAPNEATNLIDVDGSHEGFYEFLDLNVCGDGLPAIPPTPERVDAMVAAGGRDPDEVIGVLEPRNGIASVRTVAANAVMAGCLPEYFPVVLAALRSTVAGHVTHTSTTNCATPLLIVNGPVRHELDINFRESCFGVAGRANATIGRAIRLCLINIAGSLPGLVSKSVFGQPGRYTMCIGEWDEMNPWAPLHVQRGFAREQSCVTAVGATGTINITDIWSRSGESYLTTIAHTINTTAGSWMIIGEAEITIVLSPSWAEFIVRDGYSLPEVRQFLWEQSQLPLEQFPEDHRAPLRDTGHVLPGGLVPQTTSPDKFNVIVAGGSGGLHAIACHAMGYEVSQTEPVDTVSDTAAAPVDAGEPVHAGA